MLMTTKRDVWLYMDGGREFWTHAKVDGENYVIDNNLCVALQPTMNTINVMRQELSRGLVQSLRKADDSGDGCITGAAMDELFRTHPAKKLKGMDWVRVTLDMSPSVPFAPFHLE